MATGQDILNIFCGSSTIHGLMDKHVSDTKYRATALEWGKLVIDDIANRQQNWHWRWLEKTATFETVADQATYDLPSDIDTTKVFAISDTTADITYSFVPYDRFIREVPDIAEYSGTTAYWTLWADGIKLFPVPSDARTLTIRYIKTITDMTDDSTALDIPDKYKPIILDGMLVYGYKFDPEMGNWINQQQIYEAGIRRMIQDNYMSISELQRSESHRTRRARRRLDHTRSVYFPLDTTDGTM